MIFNDKELGRGAFGKVKKAYEQSNEHEELAVKIIQYANQHDKDTIKREIKILKNLPLHENLVGVKPV